MSELDPMFGDGSEVKSLLDEAFPTQQEQSTKQEKESFHYIACCRKCNAIVFACVDLLDYRHRIAKDISSYIAAGCTIERIPSSELMKREFSCRCARTEEIKRNFHLRKAQWN